MEGGTQEGGWWRLKWKSRTDQYCWRFFLPPLSSQLSCSLQAIKGSLFLLLTPLLLLSPLLPFSLALCPASIASLTSSGSVPSDLCPPSSVQQCIVGMLWIAQETTVLKRGHFLCPHILSLALSHLETISNFIKHIWRTVPNLVPIALKKVGH